MRVADAPRAHGRARHSPKPFSVLSLASAMATDQVLAALLGAFDSRAAERAACQEALQGWEGMPGYCLLLLQLYASPPPSLTADARLLAVVCLKNAVVRHWNARRAGEPAVPDADKALLRAGLLQTLDEPEPRLSAQLLLLLAQVARFDGLSAWPELMPSLLQAASRPTAAAAARGLHALYRVVKLQARPTTGCTITTPSVSSSSSSSSPPPAPPSQPRLQASRRLLPHRKQFFAMAAELLPRLQALPPPPCPCYRPLALATAPLLLQQPTTLPGPTLTVAAPRPQPLRQRYVEGLLHALAQRPPEQAAAWVLAPPHPDAAAGGDVPQGRLEPRTGRGGDTRGGVRLTR